MESKEIRGWIITLIILALGIQFVSVFLSLQLASLKTVGIDNKTVGSLTSVITIFLYACIGLIALLLILYFLIRSSEKKLSGSANMQKNTNPYPPQQPQRYQPSQQHQAMPQRPGQNINVNRSANVNRNININRTWKYPPAQYPDPRDPRYRRRPQ